MKITKVSLIVLGIFCLVASHAFAASLSFHNLSGPAQIEFGPTYTYSAVVNGSYDKGDIHWSATGGSVLKDYWKDTTYFCEVQWKENNPDDPAKIKISGKDKHSGKVLAERLYVSEQTRSRGLGYKHLQNGGGKCLDVSASQLNQNGGKVQLWDCADVVQQGWKLDQGLLMNEGGKCLDVKVDDMQKNGGSVQIWDCADVTQQKWKFDKKGRLVNGGGKCLDADANEQQQNGGKVQVWDCATAQNQKWELK